MSVFSRTQAGTGYGSGQLDLVACLTEAPCEENFSVPHGVACLEVRADLVPEVSVSWLRERFEGALLYTLRSRAEGGHGPSSSEERIKALEQAASEYDFVDLEIERDLPAAEDLVPGKKRVISWHGGPRGVDELTKRFDRMKEHGAALHKLVAGAEKEGEEIATLDFLRETARRDVISFCTGEIGAWTRLVAPRFGAPVVYAALGGRLAAPGQWTIDQLQQDYGFPAFEHVQSYYGIVGNPVRHSLSPRLHNGAYRRLGLAARYIPFHVERFGAFWLETLESDLFGQAEHQLQGLSVTAPHKASALALSGASSPLAQRIESANTLFRSDSVWQAETTDPNGVVLPLDVRGIDLSAATCCVVGCGGAGRAAAAGLKNRGARVLVSNRTEEKGALLAQRLGVTHVPLAELDPTQFDVVVQATGLGHQAEDEPPFATSALKDGSVVVEMVYAEHATRLEQQAASRGLSVVSGREVLLYQALEQFRLMTGHELPAEVAAELLEIDLPNPRDGESPS